MRKLRTLMKVAATAMAVPILAAILLVPSVPASAAPRSLTGEFGSFGGSVSKCLDVQYARTSVGTEIDSGWCNGTAAQKWTVVPCTQICPGMLLEAGVGSNMCMGVPRWDGVYNGSPVELVPCSKSDGNQIWGFQNGDIFLEGGTEWCLDVHYGDTGQDVMVDVAICNRTDAQLWAPFGYSLTIQSQIVTGGNSNCLDDYGYAANGRADNWPCNYGDAQQWVLNNGGIQDAGNWSTLQAGAPNPPYVDTVNMVNSFAGWWQGNYWTLQYAAGGFGNGVEFVNGFTGPNGVPECLDVLWSSPAAGQTVDLWPCNGTVAQAWNLYLWT